MEEQEIHLRDYFKIIYKRRYTVYTFFTIVFIVVLIGTLSTTPVYKATTKVLIEKVEPANLTLPYPYYAPYEPEFYETQYQLIKSTSVASKVVKALSLENTYEMYFKGEKITPQGNKTKADVLADIISSGIVVTPVKNSKIVTISFMSKNPEFAAMVANSVAKAYIEEILDMRMSSSRYSIEWMSKKAEEEKAKLEKSEKALQEFMKANDIVTLQDRLAITPEKLSEFNTQLIRAEMKRKELEGLYSKVSGINIKDAETIPYIASDPTIQALRNQKLRAEQNIEELSKKYGSKHPAMLKAQEELKVIDQKREQEIKRVIASIKNEYELARNNENTLRRTLAGTKSEAISMNEKYIQYNTLAREVETNRQLYDALIKKLKEESVTQQVQTVNVWVVEKAEKPETPVKPRKLLNLLLGIIIGLFGGVGLAFFFEYLDNTVKTPEDVESRIGVPVIGAVPLLEKKNEIIEEIIIKEPQSVHAESYKSIRTGILLSSATKLPKNILITSMAPEEGKTATSVNLSLTIARSGYSVVLVDSDLRKPRIHQIFRLNNMSGLSTYLAGATPDIDTILKTPLMNLTVIPAGPLPPNPSELLGSQRMIKLIELLNERFDLAIWDSPPLMTVTDGLILSNLVDRTIIIVRAGKTTYDIIKRGLKLIDGRRKDDSVSNVLGIVINGFDVKNADQYYYKYYNYYPSEKEEPKKTI
ncbi:MAG: polysaccharide biosynthesis tyrosine autokinase [Nitrospirae bacterium]|jgi:capsular exopolysaccharide synthesis family protein|nr:polysaccharide biosynthesis tyrosine autokinase [Nitrospirota bacterium]